MENKDSQRWAATELLELIANQIASYSHHNELYNSLQTEISHPEQYDQATLTELIERSRWHYEKMVSLLDDRRKAMRMLKEMAKEYDWDYHCLLKHSIAWYQFAQELLNTDMDNMEYMLLAENASKYMYECAAKYLWVELVTCGRCLTDILKENK